MLPWRAFCILNYNTCMAMFQKQLITRVVHSQFSHISFLHFWPFGEKKSCGQLILCLSAMQRNIFSFLRKTKQPSWEVFKDTSKMDTHLYSIKKPSCKLNWIYFFQITERGSDEKYKKTVSLYYEWFL